MSRRAGMLLGCGVLALFGRAEAAAPVCEAEESNFDSPGETTPTQGGTGVNGAFVPGDVAVQYVWSPYGECLASEVFDDAAPLNPVGHQGLFFIRLNGKITDKPHEPYHGGVYYNRNRMYEPSSGRWNQRDMNATGMPVLADAAYHGFPIVPMSDPYDAMGSYGDGMNLFGYLGGNPFNRSDPLGLNWWDEDIDDAIADRTGNALYGLSVLNEGAKWASIGLHTTMAIAGGLLPGSGLFEAFGSAKEYFTTGQGGFAAAMGMALAFLPGVAAAKRAMGISMDPRLAMRGLSKAFGWLRKGHTACSIATCFVAGTLIATPEGAIPIEFVRPGDWVLSQHEDDVGGAVVHRRVSAIHQTSASETIWIGLSDGTILGVTPEHPIWEADRGGQRACELMIGDKLVLAGGALVDVIDVFIDERTTIAFNLEVAGTSTYFAESVWVHNCKNWHHTVPVQILKALSPSVSAKVQRQKIQVEIPEGLQASARRTG